METIHGLNINGPAIIGTGVAFTILAVLAVGLRFTSKCITGVKYGLDDCLLLASLVLYFVAEVLVIRSDIIGRKALSPDDHHYKVYLQLVYIYSVFYFPIIALALASVLFLYRHIFYPSHIRYTSLILTAICFPWCTAAPTIEIGFPGHPISYFFPSAPRTTFHLTYLTFWLTTGILETLLEITILLLPLREIARLQLSPRKKLLLSLIFSLCGFMIRLARPTKSEPRPHPARHLVQRPPRHRHLPTFRPLITRGSVFLHSFGSGRTTGRSGSAMGDMKSGLRAANEHGRSEMGGIVMQPNRECLQGSYADARWSEGSNSPSGGWQEDGAVTAGEAIAVGRTVEVV